jgi:2'-5' RNA ligase
LTRAFAAIFPSPEARDRLSELTGRLKRAATGVKWVERENVHLTLRFFGTLTDGQLAKAASCMNEVARLESQFSVWLTTLGAFPSVARARVIWVGSEEGNEPLVRIAASLDQRFVEAGLGGADKPFSPHLTIGRVKVPRRNPELEQAIRSLTFERVEFRINGLILTKSELRPQGPIYSPVSVAKLGTAGQ